MTNADLVLVEIMPAHLRASHQAAGNWGQWPHNGATRVLMDREEALEATEGDEYDHIVRDARDGDEEHYEVAS